MFLRNKKCSNCETYYDPALKKCPKCYKLNELHPSREISDKLFYLHPVAQIGTFLVGFAYAGMLLAEIFGAIFVSRLDGDGIFKNAVLITLVYVLMLGGVLAITFTTRRSSFIKKYKRALDYIYGIGYAATLLLAGIVIANLVNIFYQVSNNANQEAAVDFATGYPILAFFVLGFLGPICEEFTYRIGLYSFLRRINKYLAFVITTLIFAFIHFNFTKNMADELWALPTYITLGFILTLAYEHRGPACSMTAHILYNLVSFALMLIVK